MIRPPWSGRYAPPKRDAKKTAALFVVIVVGGLTLFGQMVWVSKNQHMFKPFSIERIRCHPCEGTGVLPDPARNNANRMCGACFGIGYHMVRRFDEADVMCPACEGLGRVQAEGEDWRTCRRCDGRGIIRSDAASQPGDG